MLLTILSVMGSCVGCMSFVELLVRSEPGCMDLMTFTTFLFISVEGFIFGTKFLTEERIIPIKKYLKLVVVFFLVSVVNNKALSYHIPVPLCIIFRSGSLLSSLLMGYFVLRKRYTTQKYLSVCLITIGIIICTLASSQQYQQQMQGESESEETMPASYTDWIIGISMMTFALIAASYLGVCQEKLFSVYGKAPREALFFVHVLSLPGFVILWPQIIEHAAIFNHSEPTYVPLIGNVPHLWLYLLGCDIAQYCCIRSVYLLTVNFSALSVTMVITLRKFLSLLFSIWYFNNSFTSVHWIGTALVFGGTLLFGDFLVEIRKRSHERMNSMRGSKESKIKTN